MSLIVTDDSVYVCEENYTETERKTSRYVLAGIEDVEELSHVVMRDVLISQRVGIFNPSLSDV